MKATKELVWALRASAQDVLNPKFGYNWGDPSQCNCGLLIRRLLGIKPEDIYVRSTWTGFVYWSRNSLELGWNDRCAVSGMTFTELREALKEFGFQEDDFQYVEYCGHQGEGYQYKNPQFVSAFFTKLADRLEKELSDADRLSVQRDCESIPCDRDVNRNTKTLTETTK